MRQAQDMRTSTCLKAFGNVVLDIENRKDVLDHGPGPAFSGCDDDGFKVIAVSTCRPVKRAIGSVYAA